MAKKPAKKKTAGKKAPVRKKRATKVRAAKTPAKKAVKKVRKATAKKSIAKKPVGKAARKPSAKRVRKAAASTPPLPAQRALTARLTGQSSAGAKSPRHLRKVQLRSLARPVAGRGAKKLRETAQSVGHWPELGEVPSETGLRERILLCLLAQEADLGGRERGPGLADQATIENCGEQIRAWLRAAVDLKDGRSLSHLLFESVLADEMAMLRETIGAQAYDERPFDQARAELLARIE